MNQFTNNNYIKTLCFIFFSTWYGKTLSSINFRSVLTLPTLIVILLMVPGYLLCQDSTVVIPDGTEGELLPTGKADSVTHRWTFEKWNEIDGPLTTFKFGMGFIYEFAAYSQDEVSKQQIDSANVILESAFKVRDFRILLSGRVKSKRTVTWKVGIMYDAGSDAWSIRETGIMVSVPELWGYFFVGRTKEGFSLSKVMNGYATWTMERQMAIDVIPIFGDGIKWLGFLPKQRLFWNIGAYTDWLSEKLAFSTYNYQFDLRFGWLLIYSEADHTVFHLGVSYRYGKVSGDEIQVRSRPEANPAPYFIGTGNFAADHSNHIGGEVYYSSGPLMFGSEYYIHKFSSPVTDNPLFDGGEVMASYIITGESRTYSTVSGIYVFVPVNNSIFDGGPGAWEVVLRYSTLDLDGGTLTGGKFWRITPMINWYLSENFRFEIAYGYGVLNRYNLEGGTQFFQSRIQLLF
jgi:phosphate-selective porin OprO and OprP